MPNSLLDKIRKRFSKRGSLLVITKMGQILGSQRNPRVYIFCQIGACFCPANKNGSILVFRGYDWGLFFQNMNETYLNFVRVLNKLEVIVLKLSLVIRVLVRFNSLIWLHFVIKSVRFLSVTPTLQRLIFCNFDVIFWQKNVILFWHNLTKSKFNSVNSTQFVITASIEWKSNPLQPDKSISMFQLH